MLTYIFITFTLLLPFSYIVYLLYLHPLSRFPGPLSARVTPFWRAYHELLGDTPQILQQWHLAHGTIIRVAPNELDVSSPEIVDAVYKKGRVYVKSEWYDGFAGDRPTLFNGRDERLHALRRRQMAHGFSNQSLTRMEYIFDRHVRNLVKKLTRAAHSGHMVCDLKQYFMYFSHDTNGELSFSMEFGTQEQDEPAEVPPNNDHLLLSKMLGFVPVVRPFVVRYGKRIPYLRRLIESRLELRRYAEKAAHEEFMKRRVVQEKKKYEDEEGRANLMTSLVEAEDPETGEMLDEKDVVAEAFSFLVAGTHSTAMSLTFLFWHLLYEDGIMEKAVKEVREALPSVQGKELMRYAGLENALPYLSALMKETFRLTPTVQNPIPRVVPPAPATVIDGVVIPPGMVIGTNAWCMHHNPAIWGKDVDEFKPERWTKSREEGGAAGNEKYLLHFGSGHHLCIGQNMALISMWKGTVEILRRFDLKPTSRDRGDGKQPEGLKFRVSGFAELDGPLLTGVTEVQ